MKRKLLMAGISALSFFVSTTVSAQTPSADFTISQPTTCVGSVIQITDLSSDTPTSWSYTVENMTGTLTVQNPTLVFNVSGDFDITLEATNANGTGAPVTKSVLVNDLPVITVGTATAVCAGSNATLTANGATSYTWSNGTSNNSAFVPVTTAGYTVTGVDANSCKNTAVQSITVNPLPVLTLSGSNSVCAGSAFTQTVSGADTFSWSTGVSGNTISEMPTATITYTVDGTTAATGCIGTIQKLVTVNVLPTITVNNGTVCAGQTFTIVPAGASTYTFSNGSNMVVPAANTSYTVTGKSAQGCASAASAISNVVVNVLPTITVNSGSVCAGNAFTITPAGAVTYTFVNGAAVVTPVATTNYSVTGVDANGCVAAGVAVANVAVNALPVVTVNSGSICAGSVFTLTPAGAATYTLSNGSNTVAPAASTSYTVSGTDALGCVSAIAVSTVTVNALPVITVNSGSVCAGDDFTITANGAATYNYQGGSNVVTPSGNTTYTVTGVDANGCASAAPAVSTVDVTANPVLSVSGSSAICTGESTTLTATGADDIIWLVGQGIVSNTLVVNPTSTTQYSLGGLTGDCIGVAIVQVLVKPLPSVSATNLTNLVCAGLPTTITATGADTYSWSSGETTPKIVITPTNDITYTVTGTANGCSKTVTVTQLVDACTGIAKVAGDFETAVYPNPNNGSFTVKVTQATSIKIINVIGQTVYTAELAEGDNAVSLNDQVTGIYFVQLKQNSVIKTIRVVKH